MAFTVVGDSNPWGSKYNFNESFHDLYIQQKDLYKNQGFYILDQLSFFQFLDFWNRGDCVSIPVEKIQWYSNLDVVKNGFLHYFSNVKNISESEYANWVALHSSEFELA